MCYLCWSAVVASSWARCCRCLADFHCGTAALLVETHSAETGVLGLGCNVLRCLVLSRLRIFTTNLLECDT
jgi:hypothetical protein